MKRIQVLLCSVLLGITLFVIVITVAVFVFGGIGFAVAWLNGEAAYVYPKIVNLGKNESKSQKTATFHLKNLSSQDISLVGERSSCSCTFSEQIPLVAKPGECVNIKVKVILATKDTAFDQTITFMIAEPNRLSFQSVRIVSTVLHSSPSPDED